MKKNAATYLPTKAVVQTWTSVASKQVIRTNSSFYAVKQSRKHVIKEDWYLEHGIK